MTADGRAGGWTRRYGAHPLHLLSMLACFAVAGYAGLKLLTGDTLGVLVWFVGAALLHDLALVPLYGLVDRGLIRAWGRRDRIERLPQAPWINYLRVPLGLSALTLLVYFPDIFGLAGDRYPGTTGMTTDGYLARWLLLTGGLFAVAAVAYAFRLRSARPQA